MEKIEGGEVPGLAWFAICVGALSLVMVVVNVIRRDWLGTAVFCGLVASLTISAVNIVRAARKHAARTDDPW